MLGVDAGVHLAAIVKILENCPLKPDWKKQLTYVEGPFKGLKPPHASATANAAYVTRTLIDTHLITHPHLDHISAFVVNTAGLQGPRPKRLAALPPTIDAFKNHIFNNVIWPNLSDENNGAGLVTYMRLIDGGSPVLGEGEERGYVEICEGLSVKTWSVSHGHCLENHSHRGSNAGLDASPSTRPEVPRRGSSQAGVQQSPRTPIGSILTPVPESDSICVYNSSAFFISDIATGTEVLIFGDVEPDSLSLSPRNRGVWGEAARKIVSGRLGAIFIECSFDDSITNDRLYGHMAPRFLIEELRVLADAVEEIRLLSPDSESDSKKRKRRSGSPFKQEPKPSRLTRETPSHNFPASPIASTTRRSTRASQASEEESSTTVQENGKGKKKGKKGNKLLPVHKNESYPLLGLRIVIIHVKEKLTDGPQMGDCILSDLVKHEKEAHLGCNFIISKPGQAIYL